jgi:hypothetical protein
MIEQVGDSLGHPALPQLGQSARPLRKRDKPVEAAVAAAKPREPAREPATLKKVPELLLDETGQPFPVAQADDLRAKSLEVIAHDLVQRTLRGTPRFVARRGAATRDQKAGAVASEESDEIGLNWRARERQVAELAVLRRWRDRRSCTTGNAAVSSCRQRQSS